MKIKWYMHKVFGHNWTRWTGTPEIGYTCGCGVKHDGELTAQPQSTKQESR